MVRQFNLPERNQWPQVILALGLASILVAGAVVLLSLGRSESVILTLAALIAGPALAWFATNTNQKLEQVKDLSNGSLDRRDTQLEQTTQRLVEMNERLLALIAQTHPNIPTDVAERLMPTASVAMEQNPSSPAPSLGTSLQPAGHF